MSERIGQAKVFGNVNEKFVDDKRSADSLGFSAYQHGQTGRDVDMGGIGSMNAHAPGDVIAKETMENERFKNVRQRIAEITGDTMSYAQKQEMVRRQLMAKFDEIGMGDMVGNDQSMGSVDPFEVGQMRAASRPRDVEPVQPQPGSWIVEEMTARTKGGKEVLIWQVRDQRSGIVLPHKFRLGETAEKVVAVLNRTGNVNDARVNQWIRIDEERRVLVAKTRQLREAVQAGNGNARNQLAALRQKLAELDLKIGI